MHPKFISLRNMNKFSPLKLQTKEYINCDLKKSENNIDYNPPKSKKSRVRKSFSINQAEVKTYDKLFKSPIRERIIINCLEDNRPKFQQFVNNGPQSVKRLCPNFQSLDFSSSKAINSERNKLSDNINNIKHNSPGIRGKKYLPVLNKPSKFFSSKKNNKPVTLLMVL